MIILGMNDISENPTKHQPPTPESPDILKRIYLDKISNMIYNEYICDGKRSTQLTKAIFTKEEVSSFSLF